MDINTIVNIILLIIFLGLTGFFVAVEFAVVKIRKSRIDHLIAEGNHKAVIAKKVVSDLDYYLSACQLGITVTAIGLGAFTKPYVKQLLLPVFDYFNVTDVVASAASYVIALAIVSYLHVVIGEMAPKTLAIQFSEKVTLLLAPPLYYFGKVMNPFIQALNGTSRILLKAVGVKSANEDQAYSEEELKIIMVQSFQGGQIDQQELGYLENVFAFDERKAKDIMVPRTDLVTLDKNMSPEQIIAILDESNYTRYPVIENNDKDHIIGYVNANKLLSYIVSKRDFQLEQFVRNIPYVLEASPIQDALLKMQQAKVHMTVVLDEFGGTEGILTMEDILEEIVGEIRDEFDEDEVDEIRKTGENEYTISARVPLVELTDRFGIEFEHSEDIDTIGGWMQHMNIEAMKNGDDLKVGDTIKHEDHAWVVKDIDNLHIKEVLLKQYEFEQ